MFANGLSLHVCADSTSTSVHSATDAPLHDDVDRLRLMQYALTPYNRQDDQLRLPPASAVADGTGARDVITSYWDDRSHQQSFLEHLLPALLRRVAVDGEGASVQGDGGASTCGGDVFACTDCTKRYSSASNLARHRTTHQRPTTTTTTTTTANVTTSTNDRRVSRQCPHCAKVRIDQLLTSLITITSRKTVRISRRAFNPRNVYHGP